MATSQQKTTGKKNIGCGVGSLAWAILFGVAMFVIGYGDEICERFDIQPPRLESIFADQKTGLPGGAHLIEYYGGVDPDTATEEEMAAAYERRNKELMQAYIDMESEFYVDNQFMVTLTGLPTRVFWVDTYSLTMVKTDKGKGYYYRVNVTYSCTKAERDRMQEEIDEVAGEILAQIPQDADDWTKALIVHDELVKRMDYDHTYARPHRFDIYGALVEGQAVCAGYAKAYEYVMNLAGVNARYESSMYTHKDDEDAHAWNDLHTVEGFSYVDVTWDDTGSTDRFGNPYISHDYFGLAPSEIERIDYHEGMFKVQDGLPYSNASYHAKKGYLLESYDHDELVGIFEEQYDDGSNLLTVKFASKEAYEAAMDALCGSGWRAWDNTDTSELWTVVRAAAPNYDESISIGHNDELYVLNIYLYPA